MRTKRILAIMVTALLLLSLTSCKGSENKTEDIGLKTDESVIVEKDYVTLINNPEYEDIWSECADVKKLILNPEKYDGEFISVRGYCYNSNRNSVLSQSKEDHDYRTGNKILVINVNGAATDYQRKYCSMSGYYEAGKIYTTDRDIYYGVLYQFTCGEVLHRPLEIFNEEEE